MRFRRAQVLNGGVVAAEIEDCALEYQMGGKWRAWAYEQPPQPWLERGTFSNPANERYVIRFVCVDGTALFGWATPNTDKSGKIIEFKGDSKLWT